MYEVNYLSSFNSYLSETLFKWDDREVDSSEFFEKLIALTKKTKQKEAKIFFYGNGASFAFADHMALDWSKNGKIKSLSLSSMSLASALANDYSYEEALVEHFKIFGANQDIIVTISSSGNSPNIQKLTEYANKNSIELISFSGLKKDNHSFNNSAKSLFFPAKTYGMVECAHQLFLHMWLDKYMEVEEWNKRESQNMNSDDFRL